MEGTIYNLCRVSVELGERRILEVEELDLEAGQVTAVVGPNGAGKTTLLRLLAFLLAPSAGTIAFRGVPVTHGDAEVQPLRRQVTLVGQQPYLFRRSVRANVAYGLRQRGRNADGETVERALAAVGLEAFASRSAWRLSGGEAQRVALARALVLDPPVLLLDEPMASVDGAHVAAIEALVRSERERGTTVVLTTHDLNQAYTLADRVVSLVHGSVAPAPLVNLLHGSSDRDTGASFFSSGSLRIELVGDENPRLVAIDPDAIVLSRAPLASSARNCFPGEVRRVERDRRGLVVTVDCAPPLVAHITQHSYEELGLNVGTKVWVSFKTSAVHLLG